MTKVLTDSAFEEIAQILPIRERAAMLTHHFLVRQRVKELEALTQSDSVWVEAKKDKKIAELEEKVKLLEASVADKVRIIATLKVPEKPVAPPPAPPVVQTVEKVVERIVERVVGGDDVAKKIADWLVVTHQADTVRANYAKKLAKMIANGDYR